MDDFVSPFSTFKYGREDCETSPYTNENFEFPSPHMTHEEAFVYFESTFGFDANQVSKKQKSYASWFELYTIS